MKTVFIDAEKISSPRDIHALIREQLGLEEWYGMNLDALHDVLTEPGDIGIIVVNTECAGDGLREYFERLFAVLLDCADENPRLRVLWDPFGAHNDLQGEEK